MSPGPTRTPTTSAKALAAYKALLPLDPAALEAARRVVALNGDEPAKVAETERLLLDAIQKCPRRADYVTYVLATEVYDPRMKDRAKARQADPRPAAERQERRSVRGLVRASGSCRRAPDEAEFRADVDRLAALRRELPDKLGRRDYLGGALPGLRRDRKNAGLGRLPGGGHPEAAGRPGAGPVVQPAFVRRQGSRRGGVGEVARTGRVRPAPQAAAIGRRLATGRVRALPARTPRAASGGVHPMVQAGAHGVPGGRRPVLRGLRGEQARTRQGGPPGAAEDRADAAGGQRSLLPHDGRGRAGEEPRTWQAGLRLGPEGPRYGPAARPAMPRVGDSLKALGHGQGGPRLLEVGPDAEPRRPVRLRLRRPRCGGWPPAPNGWRWTGSWPPCPAVTAASTPRGSPTTTWPPAT